jgi:pyridoxine 4-dehydrogenase
VCNVTAAQLSRCQAVTPIASVQDRYDIVNRSNEPVLQVCARSGIPFFAWFPTANDMAAEPGSALARVSTAHSGRPAQIALAWLLGHSEVIVPLPGTFNPEWFDEDLAALDIELAAHEADLLDTAPGSGELSVPQRPVSSRVTS